jgi:cyanoexosortase A
MKFLNQPFLNQYFGGAHKSNLGFQVSLFCLGLLASIHLALDLYLGKQSHLLMSLLVWSSVFSLLWDKRFKFSPSSSEVSTFVGFMILSALLVTSITHAGEKIIGFFPIVAFSSWALIFMNPAQLSSYLKEFSILSVFGLPKLVPETAFGLAPVTAKFSAFMLHYVVSYPVKLVDGIHIQVPRGGVEVVPACSGISLMLHMLSISVIFLCVFPAQKRHFILLPFIAATLGFVLNGFRVAVLAALSRPEWSTQFKYWHSADGASIFVLIALLLYSGLWFCFFRPTH